MTVRDLLREARARLGRAPFAPPRREATLLLGWVLGLSEAQLLARPEQPVPPPAAASFRALLARRLTGEPVAYLTGRKEFYGRSFAVDSRVLIPRPETEHLVEAVLGLPLPPAPRVLDLGTGSGCLAVTLARELPAARVVAGDLSPGALAVAAGNVRRHAVDRRVHLLAGALGAALRLEAFDLLVSNPPYIGRRDAASLSPEVRDFEPSIALFSGDDGLGALRQLLAAGAGLRPGAWLLCEIGDGQLPAIRSAISGSALEIAAVHRDYAGVERVVVARRGAGGG